jgi:hypothetical protein
VSFDFADPAFVASLQAAGGGVALPDNPILSFMADALALSDGDDVTAWNDAGSFGWNTILVTVGKEPTYRSAIGGLPSVVFGEKSSGTDHTTLTSGVKTAVAPGRLTVLQIIRPYNYPILNTYAASSYYAAAPTDRADIVVRNGYGGQGAVAYRGSVLASTVTPALGAWSYLLADFNGASSKMNANGTVVTGNVGASTGVKNITLGGADTTASFRFYGAVHSVNYWAGDRYAEAEAYARSVLGLP